MATNRVAIFNKIQLVKPNSHILKILKSVRKESNHEKQTKDNNYQLDNHTNRRHSIHSNNQKHHIRQSNKCRVNE